MFIVHHSQNMTQHNDSDVETGNVFTKVNQQQLMTQLKNKIKNLENAHRKCSQINRHMDTIINVLMMVCSATVACFESLIASEVTRYEYYVQVSKIMLSGFVTLLAALNQMFNNSAKSETHHTLCRNYMMLGLKIDQYIATADYAKYIDILKEFTDIRVGSIGLFNFIRKKYSIE